MKGKIVVSYDLGLQKKLIDIYCDSSIRGHFRVNATVKRVGGLFYWERQHKHIRQYMKECNVCQMIKTENVLSLILVQPLPIPQAPFNDISMDFIKGLLKSNGKDVIYVMVDRFGKCVHFIAIAHTLILLLLWLLFS